MENEKHRLPAQHVLAEIHGSDHLSDAPFLEDILRRAAVAAGATVLGGHFHPFSGGGVTGVLLLAESHISIHTWPEHAYAAIDVFMCGNTSPRQAAEQICAEIGAKHSEIKTIQRGLNRTKHPSLLDNI